MAVLSSSAHADDEDISFALGTINKINSPNGEPCPPLKLSTRNETRRWTTAGFGHPQITLLTLNSPDASAVLFTHELNLTLVMFRHTGWTTELVKSQIERVAQIYSKCGILIRKATMIVTDAPQNWIDISSGRDLIIAKKTPVTVKPILYFFRSSDDGTGAWAGPKFSTNNIAYVDTVWISNDVNSDSYKALRNPAYNPAAHELAHILGDRGHVQDGSKNILGDTLDTVDDQITPSQCDAFKKHPSVIKL